ncbi:hypothetical protein BDF14DRAFT_1874796 [Spinellus fusiger]|nr:hypothetical protein BDF14DRAFT_1874796 [Spinellus fusiger]
MHFLLLTLLFLEDGVCKQINQRPVGGWKTQEPDDWVYYRQQHANVTFPSRNIALETVGGCCAPNRFKSTGFVFEDDGSTVETTGNKMVRIADAPMTQSLVVEGWYMKQFVDNESVNLTLLPTIKYPDKQALLYTLAFDRAMMIIYQFLDINHRSTGSYSSGVLRDSDYIPDITLPRYTRSVQSMDLVPILYVLPTSMLACSFIFSQAWNMITFQETIFNQWLPRAAKLVGVYVTLVLFTLRIVVDLPTYVITYARELPFLIMNSVAAISTLLANFTVLVFFLRKISRSWTSNLWNLWKYNLWNGVPIEVQRKNFQHSSFSAYSRYIYRVFGMNEFIRIPYPVKISLTILLYCLGQLIPVLTTQMVGVGGAVSNHICSWSPYLTQFQYHPDPMAFATKAWILMRIAVYISTFGAGACKTVESLVGTVVAMAILLDKPRDYLFKRSGYGVFFASFFVAWIFQLIQKRITRTVFIKRGTRFSLQNRSPLLHYWYFMMLTSMTRSLTSYFLRTLKLILRYPLFSLRVDRNAETWSVRRGDGGFVGYMGMLVAENEYNNPIMLVFIECIIHHISPSTKRNVNTEKQRVCQKHSKAMGFQKEKDEQEFLHEAHPFSEVVTVPSLSHGMQCQHSVRVKRAKTRWFLAYTLINNPMMIKLDYKNSLPVC